MVGPRGNGDEIITFAFALQLFLHCSYIYIAIVFALSALVGPEDTLIFLSFRGSHAAGPQFSPHGAPGGQDPPGFKSFAKNWLGYGPARNRGGRTSRYSK